MPMKTNGMAKRFIIKQASKTTTGFIPVRARAKGIVYLDSHAGTSDKRKTNGLSPPDLYSKIIPATTHAKIAAKIDREIICLIDRECLMFFIF
jgi:hypothetical protein